MHTIREVRVQSSPACSPRYWMTIPAGTKVALVNGEPVVAEVSKVVGGNRHDLEHYYIWLDRRDVEGFL